MTDEMTPVTPAETPAVETPVQPEPVATPEPTTPATPTETPSVGA